MKKFNVIMFSDCRGCSEVNKVFDMEDFKGVDVFERLIEMESESEDWVEYVCSMINKDGSWVYDCKGWRSIFYVEGDIEGSEFNFNLCDELRNVMVIREDSKYFGKFKKDVDVRDKGNIELYYEILEGL